MRQSGRRSAAVIGSIILLAALAPGGAAAGALPGDAGFRPDARTASSVLGHLQRIQQLTDAGGGVRTPGSAGFAGAAGYVKSVLGAAGYQVREHRFTFNYTEILAARLKILPDGADQQIQVINYTPSTPVGGIQAPLVVVPVDATTGCEESDYAGLGAPGSIVLLRRGGCTFTVKQQVAAAAGAAAVIMYNNAPGKIYGSMSSPTDGLIPVAAVTGELGEQLAADPPARVELEAREIIESRETVNLTADTARGDPGDVLVVGAHLDTIPESPGLNDDATGVAAALEYARLAARAPLKKKLRFAFWSAEEWGQVGSFEYLASLPSDELARIKGYLDLAKLGSPNFIRGVLDSADVDGSGGATGPAGSDRLEAALIGGFTAQRLTWKPVDLGGLASSDWLAFTDAGIPASGLFSGTEELKTPAEQELFGGVAGRPYDPCHATACDRVENLNRTVLRQNVLAAAHAIATLQVAPATPPPAPARVAATHRTPGPGSLR
ncbi:M28 family peptidase [Actinoplanes bogorensis]|uniref:M28 family peptidase n=1 Tax=Paractinoplanes bogorensis TaxID=1610840 RepID=A0ABS5YUZ8_9ACTN|nr:M28 family peptidase [Actinoplanes bogorensis]MBU2667272.1 M28 family peptidase [Actinoplanes bogorensis]